MKRTGVGLAVLVLAWAAPPAMAGDTLHAAVQNCTWCHGTSAQGFATAPRLAGQRPRYVENQLRSFANHTRDNPFSQQYMWGAAAALHPDAARELAAYFATLPPKPANDGDRDVAAIGRALYLDGLPEANVASCLACHGPNAEGIREIPRLGGLSYDYLKRRLKQWGQGYHSAPDTPMPRVAVSLSPDQIEALASYLSFIR